MAYMTDNEIIKKYELDRCTKICRDCNQVFHELAPKCPRCGTIEYDIMTSEECLAFINNSIVEYRNIQKEIETKKAIAEQRRTAIKKGYSPDNIPKCPTCNSTNITKIPTTSKVAGAVAFGLFSKTAKSQFKCNNCGYKW